MSGKWAGSDRASRLPPDWPVRRTRCLRVHRGVCHVCGQPGADEVDHVEPGDDHSDANLRPIHQDVPPYCHRYKSAQEGVAARAAIRARCTRPPERHPGLKET